MNTALKSVCTTVLLIGSISTAHAFDGNRKGFQIGLGLGAHTTALNFSDSNRPGNFEAEQNVAVALHVGYGFSNTITGFIGGKGGSVAINGEDRTLSFSGIGATIYLSESSPSLYITGLAGRGSISLNQLDDDDADLRDTGPAWLAGIGYEVTDRLHLEFNYGRAELVDPNNDQNTSELESAFATISYIWY